ncbi:MAG: 50S ribosomal protein L10 [Gemmataceae bacterium]
MSKKVKALELDALRKAVGGVKDYVVIEPLGPDSATEYDFRKKLRAKKIKAQMVKNTYAKKVFGEMGIALDVWGGPTVLCWGGANIKELSNTVDTAVKESKKDPKAPEKYKVKTAVADGQAVTMDVAKTMPTREEAVAELVATILGPGAGLAAALGGPATALAGILKAIEEKAPQGDAAPAAATEAPAAAV